MTNFYEKAMRVISQKYDKNQVNEVKPVMGTDASLRSVLFGLNEKLQHNIKSLKYFKHDFYQTCH